MVSIQKGQQSWSLVVSLQDFRQWPGNKRQGRGASPPTIWRRTGKARRLKVSGPQPGLAQEHTLMEDSGVGQGAAHELCCMRVSSLRSTKKAQWAKWCSGHETQAWGGRTMAVPTKSDPGTGHSWACKQHETCNREGLSLFSQSF